MRELERKQRFKGLLYSFPVLILMAIISALLARGAWVIMKAERQSAAKVNKLEAEALALKSRYTEVEKDIERLKTDEGKIEEIKGKFSVVREGEHMAVIVEPRLVSTTTPKKKQSWIKRILGGILAP